MLRALFHLFPLALLLALPACEKFDLKPKPEAPRQRVITTPPGEAGSSGAAQMPTAESTTSRIPENVPAVRVALLLPLSGESEALGKAMLDAASLALYDTYFNLPPEQIRAKIVLMPKDTGNSPSTAIAATKEAIQKGASLIIGPLFSSSVTAAAPIAKAAGVPMLSLSNNRMVASEGVYTFGFLPEQQILRVSDYTTLKNISSIAALLPNDPYGEMARDTLRKNLASRGIRVEPAEMFARTPENLAAASKRLAQAVAQKPVQALFIADGGEQLTKTLDAVKTSGLPLQNTRLLGTGLWDDTDVMKNPAMQGAWFATSPTRLFDAYVRRFSASYGYAPPRLSGLAYDAVALAAQLSLKTGSTNFSKETLTQRGGFMGPANGLYRLNADGTSERALAVVEIHNGALKTLDVAPKDFTPAGAALPDN